ncbi:MAG: hypothetical protein ACFFAS_02500 [Promethearchaeota archaeon]
MPKKYVVFFKSIGRQWFLILIIIFLIIALYDQVVAIWLTLITIIVYILSFIPPLIFKIHFKKFLKKHLRIEDRKIAQNFRKKTLQKIQKKMFRLSEKQYKKEWLIVFLNKHYIFFRQDVVKKFNLLLQKGASEKELLEKMQSAHIETRAEVKAIKDTLIKLNRASKPEQQEKNKN